MPQSLADHAFLPVIPFTSTSSPPSLLLPSLLSTMEFGPPRHLASHPNLFILRLTLPSPRPATTQRHSHLHPPLHGPPSPITAHHTLALAYADLLRAASYPGKPVPSPPHHPHLAHRQHQPQPRAAPRPNPLSGAHYQSLHPLASLRRQGLLHRWRLLRHASQGRALRCSGVEVRRRLYGEPQQDVRRPALPEVTPSERQRRAAATHFS